jgi:hypothetical protein
MDSHGDAYCKKMKSHCNESMYTTFMMHNCYKTCTYVKQEICRIYIFMYSSSFRNNCYKPPPGPCDY